MAKSAHAARRVITVLIVAALLWPLISNDDGLPLSTYPMYSGTRGETLSFITASGIDPDGTHAQLTMPEIAQTRDPLIAQSFLNDAARLGNLEVICRDIALRLEPDRVNSVEVAREIHDVTAYVLERPSLVSRSVLADCDVNQ